MGQLPLAEREQVAAIERERARAHSRLSGQQPHERQRGERFARPRFADDAQRLTALQREIHAAHRMQDAPGQRNLDAQILDLEQRHAVQFRFSGAVTSRRPSPIRLIAITSAKRNSPGTTTSHGRKNIEFLPSAISRPHDGLGAARRRPGTRATLRR